MNRRNALKGLAATGLLPFVPGMFRQAQAAEGDVVRFAIGKPAGDLNPHVYQGLWGVQDLMFEPLIGYGRDGKLEPALATSWQLSDDGRVLRLELRRASRFRTARRGMPRRCSGIWSAGSILRITAGSITCASMTASTSSTSTPSR